MASAPTRTCPDSRSASLLDSRNTTRPIFFTLLRLLKRPRPGPSSKSMRVRPCSGPTGSSPSGPTFRPDPFDLPAALGSTSDFRDRLLSHFQHHPAKACRSGGPYLLERPRRSHGLPLNLTPAPAVLGVFPGFTGTGAFRDQGAFRLHPGRYLPLWRSKLPPS